MNVYIIMDSDGESGMMVDRVFVTERKALDYVIHQRGLKAMYPQLPTTTLDVIARQYIETHEVVDFL